MKGMFLDKAHLVAHRSGGDREANNLVLVFGTHHAMLDSGKIRIEGTAAEPRFIDAQGRDFGQRFQAGRPY